MAETEHRRQLMMCTILVRSNKNLIKAIAITIKSNNYRKNAANLMSLRSENLVSLSVFKSLH